MYTSSIAYGLKNVHHNIMVPRIAYQFNFPDVELINEDFSEVNWKLGFHNLNVSNFGEVYTKFINKVNMSCLFVGTLRCISWLVPNLYGQGIRKNSQGAPSLARYKQQRDQNVFSFLGRRSKCVINEDFEHWNSETQINVTCNVSSFWKFVA